MTYFVVCISAFLAAFNAFGGESFLAKKKEPIYYKDEYSDVVPALSKEPIVIDENYKYYHTSFIKKLTHFFWLRIVFTPIAFLYSKIAHHHKIVNKKLLKNFKHTGYFMYANHTQEIGDAFMPHFLNFPKEDFFIIHPDNLALPFLGRLLPTLGGIPLPSNAKAFKNFNDVIEKRIRERKCVIVYPEAHVWPYYTGIRPFNDTSFAYPLKYDVPTFCFTNTYQKRRFSKKPKIVTYIDGPFYANPDLSPKEQRRHLQEQVYECMCERSKNSSVTFIEYIKSNGENAQKEENEQ